METRPTGTIMRRLLQLVAYTGCLVSTAAAQGTGAQALAPSGPTLFGLRGTVDFGVRSTSRSGDDARYERYRDLRNGLFSRIDLGQVSDRRLVAVRAFNIGYRDQSYDVQYNGGRHRFVGFFDSVPLNYSYLTSTPWTQTTTGVFSLDATVRQLVQDRVPGVIGVPTTPAQLNTASIYRTLARPFDLQSRRDTIGASYARELSPDVAFNASFDSYARSGSQPYGMSFAFNNANELPVPLDNRTNNMEANLEYGNEQGMFRVGWQGSFFTNQIHDIVWDNPLRATDNTPFDANGYSNGNGPAQGRMPMSPDNSMNLVSATGMYRLPARTTLTGTLWFTAMSQNDTLIPWTTNAAIANPAVYAQFPGLASLPRPTAEAKVHGVNGAFNFVSRPNNFFGLNMRYRVNNHNNLTPAFDASTYVRFDAAPYSTSHGVTQQFDIRQNTLDLTGTFRFLPNTALNLGYIFDDYERTGRSFSDMRDYTFRAAVDTIGYQYLTIRASFDRTTRLGSGFSEASLEDGGLQPGLRFYDEADRDRDRGALIFVATPTPFMDVSLQLTAGRDVYHGEGHEFGLLDNDNRSFNVGTTVAPSESVSVGVTYGRERFASHQNARNANPPGTDYGSWTDPNRTWFLDNDEIVDNVMAFVDLLRTLPKTDVRLSYDYSASDQGFIHSGPRITALSTNAILTPGDTRPCAVGLTSCFEALPNVTNTWHRLTADVRYNLTGRVAIGATYWYERFDISDFATVDVAPNVPRIDYLGSLATGYGNRPYRGQSGFIRLVYGF